VLCICCGNRNFTYIEYLNQDFINSPIFDNQEIEVCDTCGFGSMTKNPKSQEIEKFYNLEYRKKQSPYFIDFENIRGLKGIDPRAFAQIQTGISLIDFKSNDNFLDLGPGNGNSFAMAKKLLPGANLYGIELNSGAKNFYKKTYEVSCFESIEQIIFARLFFKIVLLSHSLEHIRKDDLIEFINKLKNIVVTEGICIIEVPNDDLRRQEMKQRLNDSPHLLFFSRESIKKLFIKNGFDVIFLQIVGSKRNFTMDKIIVREKVGIKFVKKILDIKSFKNVLIGMKKFLFDRLSKIFEINPRGYSDSILNQFISEDSRDCIRIIIRKKD
jgi:SAM-dependent methyltransferase